jgi:ubiquinone/menaquinone biosynthesis C-methylase UbiE
VGKAQVFPAGAMVLASNESDTEHRLHPRRAFDPERILFPIDTSQSDEQIMLERILEPEVMDSVEEAIDYDSMDHSTVNRLFVDEMVAAAKSLGFDDLEDLEQESPRILDVGTGTALIPIEYGQRNLNGDIWACDLAVEMLRLAETNIRNVGLNGRIILIHTDAKGLEFEDAEFDCVMSNSIIHHIPEPINCLREMVRMLRPGGFLFVRDLSRPSSNAEVEHIVSTYAGDENERQQQLFRQSLQAALTVEEMQEMASEFNLPPECVQQTSDRHWTLACIVP